MKVLVIIDFAHKTGGARVLAFRTLEEINARAEPIDFTIVANSNKWALNGHRMKVFSCSLPFLRNFWDHIVIPFILTPLTVLREQPDLVHYTNNISLPLSTKNTIVTIHDLSPFHKCGGFGFWHGLFLRFAISFSATRCAHIITDSEFSKGELIDLLHIPQQKISVVPAGVDIDIFKKCNAEEVESCRVKYALPKQYILAVGTISPRKNLAALARSLRQVKGRNPRMAPYKLVIVGRRGWRSSAVLQEIAAALTPDDYVVLSNIPSSSLPAIYSGASAFSFLSLYEGFGIPALEAMACGIPILSSNTTSLREIGEGAALQVDPTNEAEISEALIKIVLDQELRAKLVLEGSKRVTQYSWAAAATRTLDVYAPYSRK